MKKVKRKVLLLGLAATMLVSFTGCGNNNTTTPRHRCKLRKRHRSS